MIVIDSMMVCHATFYTYNKIMLSLMQFVRADWSDTHRSTTKAM